MFLIVLCARTNLKLYTGELVQVDLSNSSHVDHFLLFEVCEILSITVSYESGARSGQKKRFVTLRVGVLQRSPNSPALTKSTSETRVLDLSSDKVKRRVVAVSKADFDEMKYRDESIFYYDE